MAGNQQLIDEVVDPVVKKQVSDLQDQLEILDKKLVDTAKSAIILNTATGNSKAFTDYNKNVQAAAISQEKLQQQINKTTQTAVTLEKAQNSLTAQTAKLAAQQEKAAENARKASSPYQQLSKDLEKARNAAKDLGAQFGTNDPRFVEASKHVQELDGNIKKIDQSLGQSQRNVGNYGNAFRDVVSAYIPFGDGTIKVSENLKKLTGAVGESEGSVGAFGEVLGGFTIGAFAVAIGSAIYYLNEFKSTAEQLKVVSAGIKTSFGSIGEGIVDLVKTGSTKTLEANINNLPETYKKGAKSQEFINRKENFSELTELTNAELSAQAERQRALAESHKTDISLRVKYLTDAEAIEQKILDNQKADAQNSLSATYGILNAHKRLNDENYQLLSATGKFAGISLEDQAAKVQKLSLKGTEFPSAAYDQYKEYYNKRVAYEKGASNQLIQIANDRDNLNIRDERELTKALEELDNSRAEGAIAKANLVLDNEQSTLNERLDAVATYVQKSKVIAANKLADDLAAAKIPGRAGYDQKIVDAKTQKAYQDNQNTLDKIDNEADKKRQSAEDKYSERIKQNLTDYTTFEKAAADKSVQVLTDANDTRIKLLQKERNEAAEILDRQYQKGKLDRKEYDDALLSIDDEYNIDRLTQQLLADKSILETRKAAEKNEIATAIGFGATGDQLDEISSKSGVKEATAAVAKTTGELGDARKKKGKDDTQTALDKEAKTRADIAQSIGYAQQVQADFSKLEQEQTQNEINLLEEKKSLIDDTAKSEITAVNSSIQSQADKQRKINLINAQAAAQKQQIDAQERQIKEKQAKYDRAASIASIIENTAVAAIKVVGQTGIFGIALEPIIIALGAAQLASVIAAPLPKFEKGGTTSGGLFIWGEKGTEMAIEPSGKTYMSPDHASLGMAPAGTRIIPNHMIRPDKLSYLDSTSQRVQLEILAAIKKSKSEPQKRPINKINVNVDSYYQKFYK